MGRPVTITYEDFCAAAAELLAEPSKRTPKQRLSFKTMRDLLGGGSYDVLRRYIDQYLRELEAGAAPEGVSSTLQALARQARGEALQQARAELAKDTQALVADRQAFESEREAMATALATAQTQAFMCQKRVDELVDERMALHVRLDAERQRTGELQERLARLDGALQTEKDAHAATASRAGLERAATADRHEAALQAALGRFEGLQQHALRQVEDLRTKHIGQVEQLLETRLTSSAQQFQSVTKSLLALPERLVDQAHAEAQVARLFDQLANQVELRVDAAVHQVREHVDVAVHKAVLATQAGRPNRMTQAPPKAGNKARTK